MALTATPAGQREAEAQAGVPARLVSAAAVTLALWLFAAVVGNPDAFWWPLAAWGGGVVASFVLPRTADLFRSISGVVAGLVVVAGLLALFVGLAAAASVPVEPPGHLLLLALVPVGLDWHRVVRLRARVLVSGFALLLLVGLDGADTWATGDGGGSILTATAWFTLALAALWLLHRDQVGALPRPAPIGAAAPAHPPPAAADFLLVALVSLAVAVALALVVAGPGCLPWQPCARGARPPVGDLGAAGDLWGALGPGIPGGGAGTDSDAGYFYDEHGRAYAYHPGTDSYLRVPLGDAYGYDPDSGFHYDGDGRAYRYDAPTDTYRRDPGGDGLVPDGGDHYYKDPEGRFWIPHENGKPLPPGVVPSDGTLLDGIVRDGVIQEGDRPLRILPPGATLEGGGNRDLPSPTDEDDTDWGTFARVLGALLVAAALVALGVWWWRRRTEPGEPVEERAPASPDRPWAEAVVRRLVAVGARHGRSRRPGESVEAFAAALAGEPVGDGRLVKVGVVVSVALFGSEELPADHRRWVDGVLDQIDAADADAPPRDGRRLGV